MSDAFNELIAHADSVLKTLDKDYEAMQLQKSGIREDQAKVLDTLICNMRGILAEYEPTILDFSRKIDSPHFDRYSKNFEIYRTDTYLYYYKARLYWNNGVAYFNLDVRYIRTEKYTAEECLAASRCNNHSDLYVSCEDSYSSCDDFNRDSLADFESVFLNHVPSYEQLKLSFEEAVTEYVKTIMQKIQDRNETLANKIKEVTK